MTDALYQGPLGDFIEARNALAARLRNSGDADESARVKALPKPSAPAWALNQVYWHARADYDRMIAAGDRLRTLQQQMLAGRSTDPRDAMQERQTAVRQVVDRAARFLADAGQPPTDATRQRLTITADALATWGSHPQGYVPGRLDRDIEPPGFAALASLGPPSLRLVKSAQHTPPVPTPPPKARTAPQSTAPIAKGPSAPSTAAEKRAAAKAAQEAARARQAERTRLTRALQEADREARHLASARERTAAALGRATEEAESITREIAVLEEQLASMRARLGPAQQARKDAHAAAAKASREAGGAEDTVTRLRDELAELDEHDP
jgi:hypothetical protein